MSVELTTNTTVIDPAQSVFVTLTIHAPQGKLPTLPDLRDRVVGFSLTEDFAEEPIHAKDGSVTQVVNWRLVPEPCAKTYKIKPFAVGEEIAGPVYFEAPAAREAVTGGMEVNPTKDLPPLSWKLVGQVGGILVGVVLAGLLIYAGIRYLARRVKEHLMSPIERAWVELDRLLKKNLPSRGKYKDFYVELTLVVRRYVQRKYGIRAPHMTTEELSVKRPELTDFLESADRVKFAGLQATEAMAAAATESARAYLRDDSAEVSK